MKEVQKKEVWMTAGIFTILFFVISSPQVYALTKKLPGGEQISTLIGHSIVYLLVSVLVLVLLKMYNIKM
jgi:ABC-type Co2+ transport system permease subunit